MPRTCLGGLQPVEALPGDVREEVDEVPHADGGERSSTNCARSSVPQYYDRFDLCYDALVGGSISSNR